MKNVLESEYPEFSNIWICDLCQLNIIPKYNPFKNWCGTAPEKFYDTDCGNDAVILSHILENCKSYSIKSLNSTLTDNAELAKEIKSNNSMSSFF